MRLRCAAFTATLLIAGCEDPSNVGLGLIGEGGGDPVRVHLAGAQLPAERDALVTGGIGSGTLFTGSDQFLIGATEDPIFGSMDAKGYIDFSAPVAVDNPYRDGNVTAVSLHLSPNDYVFGDTTMSAQFTLSNMDDNWTAFLTRSDTTLSAGDVATAFDYTYGEDDLVISMPEEWIQEYGSILIDIDFGVKFHGFEIAAQSSSQIGRFAGNTSLMRVTTTTGTADFVLSELLTTLSKTPGPEISGRTAVQDGFGDSAIFDFNFDVDSLRGSAVSRTVVEVDVDLSIFETAQEHFVRPRPSSIALIGIRSDGTRRILHSASISEDGAARFVSSNPLAGEFTLVRSVQLAVTGVSQFEKWAITVAEPQASIDALLIYNASAPDGGPEAIVTLVPSTFK